MFQYNHMLTKFSIVSSENLMTYSGIERLPEISGAVLRQDWAKTVLLSSPCLMKMLHTLSTAPAHEKYRRSGYLNFDTIGDSASANATGGTSLARVALLSCSSWDR